MEFVTQVIRSCLDSDQLDSFAFEGRDGCRGRRKTQLEGSEV